jgi:hypothetical protein
MAIEISALRDPAWMQNVVQGMVQFIKDLVVNSDTSYKKITSIYEEAREMKNCVEAKRKELTAPLRKKTAEINDLVKEITDPLDQVIDIANAKAAGYLRMLEVMKKQEDDKLKAAAALFDAEDEIYIAPMEIMPKGDGATMVVRVVRNFRVTDMAKVPAKYLMVDEAAIKRDLKLGVSEIDGIEIFEEKITQLRTR